MFAGIMPPRISGIRRSQQAAPYRPPPPGKTKGNKMRHAYIPRGLIHELQEWLAAAHRSTGPLFLSRFHTPISPSGIRAQFKVFAVRYGLDPEVVYPHSSRHRFAKNLLTNFNAISLLANLMGHESIETTRIYLTRSSDEQRELIDRIVTWRIAFL